MNCWSDGSVVPDDQLSLAIGRRGQNVRLASQLSGWYIDILTEAEESERRREEFKTRSARFIDALNIDDVIAHCWSQKVLFSLKMWLRTQLMSWPIFRGLMKYG